MAATAPPLSRVHRQTPSSRRPATPLPNASRWPAYSHRGTDNPRHRDNRPTASHAAGWNPSPASGGDAIGVWLQMQGAAAAGIIEPQFSLRIEANTSDLRPSVTPRRVAPPPSPIGGCLEGGLGAAM